MSINQEVVCQDLTNVDLWGQFDMRAKLLSHRKPGKKETIFLQEIVGPSPCLDGTFFSAKVQLEHGGQCKKGDVVLFKGHALQAALIWQHFSWKGETNVFSLVSQWEFKSYDSTTTCAIFEKKDIASIVKPNDILCAMNWTLNKDANCRLWCLGCTGQPGDWLDKSCFGKNAIWVYSCKSTHAFDFQQPWLYSHFIAIVAIQPLFCFSHHGYSDCFVSAIMAIQLLFCFSHHGCRSWKYCFIGF